MSNTLVFPAAKTWFEVSYFYLLLWKISVSNNHFAIKGTVHPKMKILSSFTHPHKVTQRKIFWRMRETEQYLSPTIEVNGAPKQPDYKLPSKYLPLCSEQTHSYRFGSTWGWINDDRIFIFGWTVPLIVIQWDLDLIWSSSVCLESHEETEQTETKSRRTDASRNLLQSSWETLLKCTEDKTCFKHKACSQQMLIYFS